MKYSVGVIIGLLLAILALLALTLAVLSVAPKLKPATDRVITSPLEDLDGRQR